MQYRFYHRNNMGQPAKLLAEWNCSMEDARKYATGMKVGLMQKYRKVSVLVYEVEDGEEKLMFEF